VYFSSGRKTDLSREVSRHYRLREWLVSEFPDLDDETLTDTLEGLTDLHEIIAEVIRSALADEAMASGLRQRLSDMKARLARLEVQARKKKALALEAMTEAEIKKLNQPDFTASVRKGQAGVEIVSEDEIPGIYWLPQSPKLDRLELRAALKTGEAIPGATLKPTQPNPRYLSE